MSDEQVTDQVTEPTRWTPPAPPRLRFLKVIVQAVFVEDDGENFGPEQTTQPISVPAGKWAAFIAPGGPFDELLLRACAAPSPAAPPAPEGG